MSIRSIKWHIFNENGDPLCWDQEALEFDTQESAEAFLYSAIASEEHDPDFYKTVEIKECILYYDGGYFNATNLKVDWDANNCEAILINKD